MSVTIAVVVVLVLVAIVAAVALRKKPSAQALDPVPVPVPVPAPATAPASAPAATPDLGGVSCHVHGAVHGAMPPFGKLTFSGAGLTFEATSRIVAATADGLRGDGNSTIQSVGSIETGRYRHDIDRGAIEAVSFDGPRATVRAAGTDYVFEGLGPSAARLKPWLQGHGIGA